MKKRRRMALALVAVACLGGIAWLALRHSESEPVYQGKPLSYWLTQYTISHRNYTNVQQITASNLRIDAAVRHLGTNATPTLLRMLRAKDSALTIKLMNNLMPLVHKQKLVKFDYFPAALRNSQAAWAFAALDGMDNSAVPEVIRIYEAGISKDSQTAAIRSLATFTSQNELRVPIFIKALQDTNYSGRQFALTGLTRIGKDAKPAVPAILRAFKDPDCNLAGAALVALQEIDPAALAELLQASGASPPSAVK